MSYIIVPSIETFFRLPTANQERIFKGAHSVFDKNQLEGVIDTFYAAAALAVRNIKPSFNVRQFHDLETRPTIAVIADGATIHTNILTPKQHEIQKADGEKAVELGRNLAERGWRVVLPGYTGLCENIMEGIREAGGQYIVVMNKRSLKYDDSGKPILPQNGDHGFYIITNTLAESKSVLFALSDSLVYFKGGLRTLDIFTDHFVLQQISMLDSYRINGDHKRKLVLMNDDGFWQPVLNMTNHMIAEGFVDKEHREIARNTTSLSETLAELDGTLRPGGLWPGPERGVPELFIPSMAITLAAELSRASVMRQIRPTTAEGLKSALAEAKTCCAHGNSLIDPCIQNVISREIVRVYCGSRPRGDVVNKHTEAGYAAGYMIAESDRGLVYGGATKGIMGKVGDGSLAAKNSRHSPLILAVTPFSILLGTGTAVNEGFHPGLAVTIAAPGMQERKMFMSSLVGQPQPPIEFRPKSVLLSGGWGSVDETIEDLVLGAQGVVDNELIVCSIDGYWDCLPKTFEPGVSGGYTDPRGLDRISYVTSESELEQKLARPQGGSFVSVRALNVA